MGIASSDRAELNGLRGALGDELKRVALAPIKAQVGNLGAGSGVDAAAAALSIHAGQVPPAPNTKKVIDGQRLNVSPEARDMPVNVAISSVYSLGGQNAALVFRKPE
jgi:3-oxoacyl-[acyl-carrier-protein] synthase II